MNDIVYIELPPQDLHDSPFNYRETIDVVADAEMLEDIKAHGRILEPLLVRPRIGPLFGKDLDAAAGHEVVAGSRRKRLAIEAGLATVPCMVRAMDDAEARRVQISENLLRKDVHPMEEARGFQVLVENDGETAQTIAAKFGKTLAYVYARLKLLEACPEIRKACIAGEIGSEIALLFARQPAALQVKALDKIKGTSFYRAHNGVTDGGKEGTRAVRDFLNEYFMLDLKEALWTLDDATLLPAAGACTTCPKRSGCSPELFADVVAEKGGYRSKGGDDTCTDPDCFAAKKKQHLVNEAAAMAAKNGPAVMVIGGNKARSALDVYGKVKDSGAYIALDKVKAELAKARSNAQANSKIVPPQVVAIQDQRSGKFVKAVARADLVAAGVKMAEPKKQGGSSWEQQEAERKVQRARDQIKIDAEVKVRLAILDRIRAAAAASERSAFDLRIVARAAYAGVQYHDRELIARLWTLSDRLDIGKKIDALDLPDLTRFVLDCALVRDVAVNYIGNIKSVPPVLMNASAHYGIDMAAVREAAKVGPTPSEAAPAAEGSGAAKKSPKAARAAKGAAPAKTPVNAAELRALAKVAKGKGKALRAEVKDDAGVAGDASGQAELAIEGAE